MTSGSGGSARREGLAAPEGVDEGSARGTREGAGEARDEPGRPDVEQEVSASSPGPRTDERAETTGRTGAGADLLGEPPHGAPEQGEQAGGPVDMESESSRAARAAQGPGQQLQEGEG